MNLWGASSMSCVPLQYLRSTFLSYAYERNKCLNIYCLASNSMRTLKSLCVFMQSNYHHSVALLSLEIVFISCIIIRGYQGLISIEHFSTFHWNLAPLIGITWCFITNDHQSFWKLKRIVSHWNISTWVRGS